MQARDITRPPTTGTTHWQLLEALAEITKRSVLLSPVALVTVLQASNSLAPDMSGLLPHAVTLTVTHQDNKVYVHCLLKAVTVRAGVRVSADVQHNIKFNKKCFYCVTQRDLPSRHCRVGPPDLSRRRTTESAAASSCAYLLSFWRLSVSWAFWRVSML